MVKSKRDLVTTRKRPSLTKSRTIIKALSRPTSAVTTPSDANIRVLVRVRPTNEKEQGDNFRNVVKVVDDQMLIFDPKEDDQPFFYHGVQQRNRDFLKKANKNLQFVFDKVFNNASTNTEVFENSTQSLIKALMQGYNCSVFAYGATGAGKTHTMIGNEVCPGITYLTMAELFKATEDLATERDFNLAITYLEVYNELVKDLLNPGPPLQLREDSKYGVLVAGLKVEQINGPDQLFHMLAEGNKNRTQHPTDANAESSRSHAVFQVYLQMTMKGTGEVRTAKLSMIDLAGSERGSATGFGGARFTEGANINKSLLALGNCINSLADGHRHVPYRDSKLTRLLKDSLGGNCQTVMIANVSPSSLSFEDTYNTLKYAMRAKKIKAHIKKNIVNVEMHVGHYVKLVEELQDENKRLKTKVEELSKGMTLQKDNDKSKTTPSDTFCGNKDVTIIIESPVEDESIKQLFMTLVKEKLELLEREYQLQSSEIGMENRCQLKKDYETRLSRIFTSSPDLRVAHRKINDQVNRFEQKSNAVKSKLESVSEAKASIEIKMNELIAAHPSIKNMAEVEMYRCRYIEQQYKAELGKKQKDLLLDSHKEKCMLLEKMACLLKDCYMQIVGHRLAPPGLIRKYEELISDFQGRRNITWDTQVLDSGISSTTSLATSEIHTEQEVLDPFNSTYVSEPAPWALKNLHPSELAPPTMSSLGISHDTQKPLTSTPRKKTPTQQMLGKVIKSPLNRRGCRRSPLARIENSKMNSRNRGLATTSGPAKTGSRTVLSARPPFRS